MNNLNSPTPAGIGLRNLALSEDGQIHLSVADLSLISLVHLISGLDEDIPHVSGSAAVVVYVTGYTEWVTAGSPAISVGWDWQMQAIANQITVKRVGLPRSNLVLQDDAGKEIGQHRADHILAEWIDNMPWKEEAIQFIRQRYQA